MAAMNKRLAVAQRAEIASYTPRAPRPELHFTTGAKDIEPDQTKAPCREYEVTMLADTETISFLPMLDAASDSREQNLCRTWKNAVINDCGVFVENRIDIEKRKSKNKCYPQITIHCALEYPKVYYSFEIMGLTCGGGCYPGHDSRNFDVHEHAANVCLMVEHELRSKIKSEHKIPEKMISEIIDEFKNAITTGEEIHNRYETKCAVCGKMVSNGEILESEKGKLCIDCWEKEVFKDDEGNETEGPRDENGWYICPKCGEKVANPVESGLCYECDFLSKNPYAKKQYCSTCIHFRYHSVYDKSDFTEFSCAKNLEAKDRDDYCYSCKSFKKRETVEEIDFASDMEEEWINNKPMEKCAKCKKEFLTLYSGLCLPCYEKNKKKADEIRRSFKAEGWKEVPEEDYEIAKRNLCGWIDERKMDQAQKRPRQRYFWIDEITLKYAFCFLIKDTKEE